MFIILDLVGLVLWINLSIKVEFVNALTCRICVFDDLITTKTCHSNAVYLYISGSEDTQVCIRHQ